MPELLESESFFPSESETRNEAIAWLDALRESVEDTTIPLSFSPFFSSKLNPCQNISHIYALLPPLPESINSTALVRHCITVICKIIEHVNPGQSPVITGGHLVYVLGKQVQFIYPLEFDKVIWMMSPLHIEMAFISAIGDWLERSDWVEIFKRSKINTVGRIENFFSGINMKQSCYVHQVSLTSLVYLSNIAFKDQTEFGSYVIWRNEIKKRPVIACYWLAVNDMEMILFYVYKKYPYCRF